MVASRVARGIQRGQALSREIGAELRQARLGAGLTLDAVARAARMSASELSRVERGAAPWLTIGATARICSVVGLNLWLRAYPAGDALRDAAHSALTADFLRLVPAGVRVAVEVPIGAPGDLRAWDLVLVDGVREIGVEVETRLLDAQALARRVQHKVRDSGLGCMLVVLRDTRSNRAAYASAHSALDLLCPASSDSVLQDLRAGRGPAKNGVVFVRRSAAIAVGHRSRFSGHGRG